jgi:N-acetylmuramoyl-L-alanine amidase
VQAAPAATPLPSNGAQKPVIVLDPGHGGVDTGALGREHAIEKYVVLDFAKALGAKLRTRGNYRVVFTREDDSFVSLGQRVRIARNLNAALFVSVHADALARDGDEVQGATVYTVSDRASDAEAARVAEHENKADAAAGEEAKEDASDVNDILFELTRRETRAYSHVVARSLTNYWKVAARLNKNPRRSAGFVVLKAPDVPSILLELGYLSNEEDVADLTSPAWREKAAEQTAKAIDAFFAQRQPENQPENLTPAPAEPALKATQSTGN